MKTRIFQRIFHDAARPFLTSLALFALCFNHKAIAQDFWQQANGPYGGLINGFAVHPTNGNIFAVTEGSGVFRSENDGDTWTPVNTNLTELRVYSITIANDPGQVRIFVGTANCKVFRSTNNGDSWELVNSGLPTALVDVSALIYRSAGEIYSGTRGQGVYKSTNYGQAWSPVSRTGLNSTYINALLVDATLNVLAGTDAGIFRLDSSTGNWQAFNTGLSNTARVWFFERARDQLQNRFYYFAATSAGIYFSTNGNNSWAPSNSGLSNTNVRCILNPDFSGSTIWAGTEGGGIFRSDNFGVSWREVNAGLQNKSVRCLATRAGRIFSGTSGSGAYRLENNGTDWRIVNNGLLNISIKVFAQNSAGQIFAGTWGSGVYRSDDHGGNWTPISTNLADMNVAALAINSNGHIFAGTRGGVFRSTTNGDSWTAINTNLTRTDVRALAIKSNDEVFAGTGDGGIFRLRNGTTSWEVFNAGLSPITVGALFINSNQDIYAGLNGINEFNSAVFRLRSGTTSWEQFNSAFGGDFINTLAFNLNNDLFAGTTSVVYLSSNGAGWVEKSAGLGGRNIQSLAINAVGHIFAGTKDQGVFISTNRGDSWIALNNGLGNNINIQSLIIDAADGYIFAGTDKAGAFRSRWTTAAKPGAATDAVTNLSSNSARLNGRVNPNNLSTTAKFQYGPTASYVSEAAATQNPGSGTSEVAVSANISGLSPGIVYHFRVVATNTLGTTNGADQTFTTSGTAPTVSTSAATNIGPYSATLSGMVNPNGRSTEVKFQYGTTMSYARDETVQDSVRGTTPVSASVIVTNLLPNTTYHYRLVAANDAGTTNGNNQTFATLLPAYPANLSLNTTINFPAFSRAGDFRPVDYQLVGLPGNSDSSVAKYLRGNHKKDWQVYWDNGAASDFLVEYNGGSEFNFKVGRAFWIVHKGQFIINRSIPSAPLAPSAPLSIAQIKVPLRSGWNLIANPYSRPVAWARIRDANNVPTPKVTDPIWAFNQMYSQADSLKPYAGYCFYNRQNLDTLRIPYSLYYPPASAPSTVTEPTLWRVHIALSSSKFIEKAASFGVSHEASAKLDALDFRKPRAIAAIPSVAFNRSAWDKSYGIFATDIRPEFEDKESWDFEVQSPQREELKLTFSGINRIPARFAVYLIDAARAHFVNLRNDSLYNFTPATDISKFTVRVGKAEALQEQLDALIPKEFALEQNFPNPFNPTTAIPVIVPVTTEVKLKVYDLLGKEVKTLYSGSLEPGRHFFNWDGRDEAGKALGTGVYFYRLTTDRHTTLVGKMILIR